MKVSVVVRPRSIPISRSSIITDFKLKWCIFALCMVLSSSVWLDAREREPVEDMGIMQQDEETLQWFRDAKFGMFLHWGLYAVEAISNFNKPRSKTIEKGGSKKTILFMTPSKDGSIVRFNKWRKV